MLAELAAANAAYQVIKTTLQNTGEIAQAGQALATWFNAKTELQKAVNKKGQRSDLEEFLALEELKQKEDELKQMMIWMGRPGLWTDWISFQAKAARQRREAEKEEARQKALKRERMMEYVEGGFILFLVIGAGALIAFIIWLIVTKGGQQ